jgi:hypothetical protein
MNNQKRYFDKLNIELVISSYKESLDWINNVKHKKKVYSKEWKILPNTIHLPNFGRESQTYLHHIYHNYENLSDITIFCQGMPFDHCPKSIEIVNLNSIQEMNITQNRTSNSNFCPLSINLWNIASQDLIHKERERNYRLPLIDKICKICFNNLTPKSFTCIWGAMFAVSKINLLKYKKTYASLLNLHDQYWSMPWVMEFLWMQLFEMPINKSNQKK